MRPGGADWPMSRCGLRPPNSERGARCMGPGITCAEGPLWIEQRKFAMRHLRNICMNNCVTNSKIHFEIDSLINIIDKEKKVEPSKLLPFSVLNVLWSLVASNKIGNHTEQIQLLNIMCERTRAFDISGGILGQYPWFRHIAPDKSGYNLIKKLNNALKNFLLQTINNHHSDWSEGDNNDFIYSFISEIKKHNGKDTTFTDEQLLLVCLDLFVGGFTTTSGTLDFIFLLMIHHQDVQKKIQKVLDATFCKDQPIEYDDRYKVPYVEAVIRETQRFRPVGPILGPRRNIDNINLNGYVIPKNSTILFNLRSTLMSKEIWGDPERFRPERFLDEQGKLISYPEFIPFGLGLITEEDAIIEVKTLFSASTLGLSTITKIVAEMKKRKKYICLECKGDSINLKKNHDYYYQKDCIAPEIIRGNIIKGRKCVDPPYIQKALTQYKAKQKTITKDRVQDQMT
ncbi:hypothetical protein FQR65_LT19305 [Abscondita terminalis]|nr:hypothetical protein FQR65_LT19305 [Abscondita terminalis]